MGKSGVKTTAKAKPKPKTSKKAPAKQKAAPKKPAVNARKKQEETAILEIPHVDLCGIKLTAMQHSFIVNYVTPGQPCFHNAYQSALKAGYSEAVAKSNIYGLLQNPDFRKIIKANERLIQDAVHSAAMRALEIKINRSQFDPLDYYEEQEITITTRKGDEITQTIHGLKPLEKMTPEQRMCIDGTDYKGQASLPVYILPDRGKELNDVIKLDSDMSRSSPGEDGEEETMEIIMERLTVKKTIRKAKDEISEAAHLIIPPKGTPITEL